MCTGYETVHDDEGGPGRIRPGLLPSFFLYIAKHRSERSTFPPISGGGSDIRPYRRFQDPNRQRRMRFASEMVGSCLRMPFDGHRMKVAIGTDLHGPTAVCLTVYADEPNWESIEGYDIGTHPWASTPETVSPVGVLKGIRPPSIIGDPNEVTGISMRSAYP